MNGCFFTGYLRSEPHDGWTPATATAPAQRKLTMDVWIRDSKGEEFPFRCIVSDPQVIEKQGALLTPGRVVIVTGELSGRPFTTRDRQTGWTRDVNVFALEIPDRGGKAA